MERVDDSIGYIGTKWVKNIGASVLSVWKEVEVESLAFSWV